MHINIQNGICKSRHWNLGIGTDIINVFISSPIRPMVVMMMMMMNYIRQNKYKNANYK